MNISKRAFPRTEQEGRIRYADPKNRLHFLEATMFNLSEAGMYFESRKAVKPGSEIWIDIVDRIDAMYGAYVLNGYKAEVRWCRELNHNKKLHYGIGVRFVDNVCAWCEQRCAYEDIKKIDRSLLLCSCCAESFFNFPDGALKDGFKNYLIGNVI